MENETMKVFIGLIMAAFVGSYVFSNLATVTTKIMEAFNAAGL